MLKLLISQYSNFKNSGEEWALHEIDFKKSLAELAAKVDLDGKLCFSSVKGIVIISIYECCRREEQGRFSQILFGLCSVDFWFLFTLSECWAPQICCVSEVSLLAALQTNKC